MTLNQIVETSSKKFANQPALTMQMGFRTVNLTYADVYELAQKVAILLAQNNINKGDKVLICAPNSPYWVCVFWGCLLRGAVIVPLNIQSTSKILQAIAQETKTTILFKFNSFRLDIPANIKTFNTEFLPEYLADINLKDYQPATVSPDDLVQIMYTSGTTGNPKGVMHTHNNIYSNLMAVAQAIELHPGKDRLLSILPLSHIYEQTMGLLLPYSYGIQVIYVHSAIAIRDLLKKYKITRMLAVPEFLQLFMSRIELGFSEKNHLELFHKLINLSEKINQKWFSRLLFYPVLRQFGGKLHTIASGGAALNPDLAHKWEALGITILQGYGLTETSPVVATNTYHVHKLGSVGKLINGVQVKLSDKKEILVKGPNVFQGYYLLPEKTAQVISPDGWFNTEDLGEFDADGFLYIKGREKYLIKGPGGQNVYPEDIEFELNKIDGVIDSCVLGIDQEKGNTEIHAALLLDPAKTLNPAEIIQVANSHLASYQQINAWTVWHDIDFPRTPTRKIKKLEVQAHLKDQANSTEQPLVNSQNQKLINIISHITGTPVIKINPETVLVRDLKIDSLLRVELVSEIEFEFRTSLSESDITNQTTVGDLEKLLLTPRPQVKKPVLKHWPITWWARTTRAILQGLFLLIMRYWVKIKITGLENLRQTKGPFLFMPNHVSYFDGAIVLMALPSDLRARVRIAAARDFLYKDFWFCAWLADLVFNSFPIQRESEDIKLGLEHMGQVLDENYALMLFPEGQVSKDGQVLPLKQGAGLTAVDMQVPVIPIKIDRDIQKIFPYDKLTPHAKGTVTVTFGAPIRFKQTDSYITATEQIEQALKEL
jgi:long-chain acyl-CoA synthetase